MSYTMTIDAPEKVTSYVERRGPRFKAMLGSLFVAFVTSEMQQEEMGVFGGDQTTGTGLDFFNRLRKNAPLLDDEDTHVFDRVKDCGRIVELA